MKKTGKNIICQICQKSFYISGCRIGQAKFCSHKCYGQSLIGIKHSDEWKRKMSIIQKGKTNAGQFKRGMISWNKELKGFNAEYPRSDQWRRNISKALFKGTQSLIATLRENIEYKDWMRKVFQRDNYTCQECFQKGNNLHAHHIKPFHKILQEFLHQYNQFSPIEDKDTLIRLSFSYKPFWDIHNGETLCVKCHIKIHPRLANRFKLMETQ